MGPIANLVGQNSVLWGNLNTKQDGEFGENGEKIHLSNSRPEGERDKKKDSIRQNKTFCLWNRCIETLSVPKSPESEEKCRKIHSFNSRPREERRPANNSISHNEMAVQHLQILVKSHLALQYFQIKSYLAVHC
jgi:hypothetical protein